MKICVICKKEYYNVVENCEVCGAELIRKKKDNICSDAIEKCESLEDNKSASLDLIAD